MEVRDITVSEHSQRYTRLEQDSPGPAGTYYVRRRDDEVYVDWSLRRRMKPVFRAELCFGERGFKAQ